MATHRSTKGLNLPILGEPSATVDDRKSSRHVSVLAADYPGLRPTMHVKEGDSVRRGQTVLEDKKNPGVRFAAPGAGKVVAVHRGDRRAFQSLVIELDASERRSSTDGGDDQKFSSFSGKHPQSMSRDEVRDLLVESGEWAMIRRRPFSRVAELEDSPSSICVTAMDTNPLAPPVSAAIGGHQADFERGLIGLSKLTTGTVFVCTAPESVVSVPSLERVRQEVFAGPHPAGTPGFHVHRLDPVNRDKVVWFVNYQDVVAMGRLFESGRLHVDRIVSLAGPMVREPRLLKTRVGADVASIVDGELVEGEARTISGSVLSGRIAAGDVAGYLGRYHQQISVIREERDRHFLGWLGPGFDKFSVTRAFLSTLTPSRKFAFTTSTQGSPRSIVPLGSYERVFPMDILPTFMLRALVMKDVERAEQLGCLELDEEDLALCSFVCPGKIDYGAYLREVLTMIEKEG